MEIDKQFLIGHLRELGKNEHVEKALQELPDKIDHEKHAKELERFGIDPGKLAEKFAATGLGAAPPQAS